MKYELEEHFIGTGEVKGFEFSMVKRNEAAAIFSSIQGNKTQYEVFKRRYGAVCIDYKNHIYSETDLKEGYPKAKEFGLTAWTYFTLEEAIKRYTEITKAFEKRKQGKLNTYDNGKRN